jgi:streptogramin lyase
MLPDCASTTSSVVAAGFNSFPLAGIAATGDRVFMAIGSELQTCALDDCTTTSLRTFAQSGAIVDAFVQGSTVYFVHFAFGEIASCPIAGCDAVAGESKIATSTTAFALAADEDAIYYAHGSLWGEAVISRCQHAECTPATTITLVEDPIHPKALAVDEEYLYFTDELAGQVTRVSKTCTVGAGDSCGSCGGTTRCDGSCTVDTPANYGEPCGECGGTWQCDRRCSAPTPSSYGASCQNCGATIGCDDQCGPAICTVTDYSPPTTTGSISNIVGGGDGNVWFTVGSTGRFGRITPQGVIDEYTLPSASASPSCITWGPDDNVWIGENLAGGKLARVVPPAAGAQPGFTEFPDPASGYALAIAAGPDDNLWYTTTQCAVVRVTTAGVFTEYPLPSCPTLGLGITAGADGNLWVTLPTVNRIALVATGGSVSEWDIPTPSAEPTTITLGSDGNVWFVESLVNKIGRITPAGVITEFDLPSGSNPRGIAPGPDGNIWYTALGHGALGRLTPTGATKEFGLDSSKLPSPGPLALGPGGDLWFGSRTRGTIGRLHLD